MNEKEPNILFIVADQYRYDSVGCNNAPTVKTPNPDAPFCGRSKLSESHTLSAWVAGRGCELLQCIRSA